MSLQDPNAGGSPVAIVGIGCRFPGGADDAVSFWRLIRDGVDAITEIPPSRIDLDRYFDPRPATPGRMMTRRGGYLAHIDEFDADFFGISPREAERLDPQQRVLLELAWEALEDAGQDARKLVGSTTGVFVGQWVSDFESRLFADPEAVDFQMTMGSGRYATSGRISYCLGLRGPSLTIDTACSSSLVGVLLAVRSIRCGESSLALAGGVNVILQPQISVAYSQSRMMAPDGYCKFGDARGDGYVRSEGAGLVVLKALDRAIEDGDRIYAVIRGGAVNNDGSSGGSMGRPSRLGQEELLRSAYRDAGIDPKRVGYIEAHGTGTRAGDPVELGALGAVLGEGRAAGDRIWVGSVKTNIGHTEGAAGVAGLIKAALALHHGAIPPSLHFREPNPAIAWAAMPLDIPCKTESWPTSRQPRIAGVMSFGIGGTNAHAVLEEAATESEPRRQGALPRATALLPISAKSPAALRALATRHADLLAADSTASLHDVCWNAATRRTALEYRASFVASDASAMADALRSFAAGEVTAADAVRGDAPHKIAFVVPGQGGQWLGMARELAASEPVFRAALQQCDAAARSYADWSIIEQLEAAPDDAAYRLDQIDVIQPVLVALAIAYAALWRSIGVEPDAVVGHSMGEVGAAHIAGVLDLDQAMRIICKRSALMRRASGRGAMALVELSLPDATARLAGLADRVCVAVNNGPRSCVISGDPPAVQQVMAELEREQVFCRLINVDVASHSPQMEPLVAELQDALAGLEPAPARVPICSTVLGRLAPGSAFEACYWAANLRQTVRFGDAVNALIDSGSTVFVELGPHPILLPSIEQVAQQRGVKPALLASGRRDTPQQAEWLAAVGRLFCAGHDVDWQRLMPHGNVVPVPGYPWQRERFWVDAAEQVSAAQKGPRRPKLDAAAQSMLHEPRWEPIELPHVDAGAGAGASWLLLADDAAVAAPLAAALRGHGAQVEVARFDDGEPALAAAAARGARKLSIALLADADEASYRPIALLQSLLRRTGIEGRLWLLTRGAHAVAGYLDRAVNVDHAAACGAGRVIAEEQPAQWGGMIDLDPSLDIAAQAPLLARRLCADVADDQLALRDGACLALRIAAVDSAAATAPAFSWRTDAAYLITGGLGGVALKIAAAMVRDGARRLVLLARTPLPPRAEWASITADTLIGRRVAAVRALEAAGAAIHLLCADIADESQLSTALQRYAAEAWPPIRGVIHAVAVLDNRLASQLDRTTFDRVVHPKLDGARLLDRLLPELDVFVMFSSISAFLAPAGMANYAAANAGLDALAQQRRARGKHALSIQWGPWANVGLHEAQISARNVEELERQGIQSFSADTGVALFGSLLQSKAPVQAVLPADWAAFRRARRGRDWSIFRHQLTAGASDTSGEGFATRLAAASAPARLPMLEAAIRQAAAQVLRLPAERIDPRRPLGTMGLGSLMSLELRNRLETLIERPLSATLAFNYPTVELMAAHLDELLEPAAEMFVPEPVLADDASDIEFASSLARIATLSDDDIARALRDAA